MYNKINKGDTIFALLAPLIQNRQFRACIARKEFGRFDQVGRKYIFCKLFEDLTGRQNVSVPSQLASCQ